ncbi:MAG: S8 family peptidase [Acidobacteriota bacterium]
MPDDAQKPSDPVPGKEDLQPSANASGQIRHQEGVIQADDRIRLDQETRRDELRRNMMRSIVTEPLLSRIQQAQPEHKFEVIISLNELFKGGIDAALGFVKQRAEEWGVRYATVSHYCFACLTKTQILALSQETRDLQAQYGPTGPVVYRIWEDTDVSTVLTNSVTTIKADAAQRAFQALGENIVWAVLDSGIQGTHPHFHPDVSPGGPFNNLEIAAPLEHTDFTPLQSGGLVDEFGHGTHVAGIIAGYWASKNPTGEAVAGGEVRDEQSGGTIQQRETIRSISGVAPKCKLLSLKVVADQTVNDETNGIRQVAGQGKVSWILQAIEQIQQWNQHGKRLLIHGVNMSLGYEFDPRWFGCGQSPICVEVNRLVKSGVAVVVSAGNAGYSSYITASGVAESRFSDLTITDPGNAELAVTVGSTHRDMPHLYGVSYFSSRGPTGDGRLKPDLVAPGERIVSCAAGLEAKKYPAMQDANGNETRVLYCEQTGTSMAAPHVSGAIAAFLSVRREFIGDPERVKEIFLNNSIDLRRERKFQGAGLVDLMKVLQAV